VGFGQAGELMSDKVPLPPVAGQHLAGLAPVYKLSFREVWSWGVLHLCAGLGPNTVHAFKCLK